MKIRDCVEVAAQPTVVRLEQICEPNAQWISDSYYLTRESGQYLQTIKKLLIQETGCGMFLIGHYGSGKSHFLAYLSQQIESGTFASRKLDFFPLSLLHYKAAESLESILDVALGMESSHADRRKGWDSMGERHPGGFLLLIDELSEFLRSKPTPQSFNEDLRFLQFLGEWAQSHPFWLLAALQEQIEHTGDIEYDLYRKIKDRFPVRFLISPGHVRDLIAHRILRKKPAYLAGVEKLSAELKDIYPSGTLDYTELCEVYPLHPATLQLLEEVRDRFSQARGIIDFTLTRLLGNEIRGIEPFLDQPWGHLITPDLIVDHFADLFEIQPEFLGIAQKALPYFRERIPVLFESKMLQELAWRILKLLILIHLSPRRHSMSPEEAARWLLLKISKIDPARNQEVVRKILDTLVDNGSFIRRRNSRYWLDLEDDSKANLDKLLAKAIEEIRGHGDAAFESLISLLRLGDFDPFSLPRDRWHIRKIQWHFHEREINIYFGGGSPPEEKAPGLQIGLPWGPPIGDVHCYRVLPTRLELTPDLVELAALLRLKERPLPEGILARIAERISARSQSFLTLVRSAYGDAAVIDPNNFRLIPPHNPVHTGHARWINAYGEWVLKQTYPSFERFAPSHGPLSRDAYRQFMKYAGEQDLCSEDAPDIVRLIREAYLVPMDLMQRRGTGYVFNTKLENHELVRLLIPMIEHHPSPSRIYQHLGAPIYGLVPDQIHLILIILLIQGEIDILKGQHSFRDTFETLPNPQQYDRILPGRALRLDQLKDLQALCESFRITTPKQWTVLAQKRAIEQLGRVGSRQRDLLAGFHNTLKAQPGLEDLAQRVEKLISQWLALEKGEHELQAFQHFLFAIGSVRQFIADALEIVSLPARFDKLLREAQRYRHLFGYSCVAANATPETAVFLEALEQAPSLAEPEALERWLEQARLCYDQYRLHYGAEHERWWGAVGQHHLWAYRIPGTARSKHLGISGTVRTIEALQEKAKTERCQGLSPLEFQPLCRCGFDGKDGPISETLRRFDELVERMETEMALFFQQDRVKQKMREWVDQRIEMNSRTLSYLEDAASTPQIENLALFDQHLAGLELIHQVRAEALLDLLGESTWEKSALMKALEKFFSNLGPRITVSREIPASREELVAWCCKQALPHGSPLPAALTPVERRLIPTVIQPEWISEKSLMSLEQLGLGDEGIDRVIMMLLDGKIPLPAEPPSSGPVAVAMELLAPKRPECPGDLVRLIIRFYGQNDRFLRLRPEPWLNLLDRIAQTDLDPPPQKLTDLISAHTGAQWIVIDALGLPLVNTVREALQASFADWEVCEPDYAWTTAESNTDAFYNSILDCGIRKFFEKINVLDELLHNRQLNLEGLSRLARVELDIIFRRIVPGLDSTLPVIVFGDHGFRLAKDGHMFVHGGSSPLEQITPVFVLNPLGVL